MIRSIGSSSRKEPQIHGRKHLNSTEKKMEEFPNSLKCTAGREGLDSGQKWGMGSVGSVDGSRASVKTLKLHLSIIALSEVRRDKNNNRTRP